MKRAPPLAAAVALRRSLNVRLATLYQDETADAEEVTRLEDAQAHLGELISLWQDVDRTWPAGDRQLACRLDDPAAARGALAALSTHTPAGGSPA